MMRYMLTPEQLSLLEMSRMTWRRREAVKRHALPFGEETITETILMDLAASYPGKMLIVPFNKAQEAKTGSDWAWAFQSANGQHVLPMLVQAKLLDVQDIEYPEITRKIGKTTVRQIDRLIDTANRFRWPALYAFYNHIGNTARIPNNCKSIPNCATTLPESWGISVADAWCVRSKLNDQTFDTHCLHSVPLHCLLCSGGTGTRGDLGSAGLALRTLMALRTTEDRQSALAKQLGDAVDLPDEPFTELPDMFREAEEIANTPESGHRDELLARVAYRNPNIAGAIIFKDGLQGHRATF